MKKKMQVFISSTYSDLIDERQIAVQAILEAGHIPAGMELFQAGNESQLQTIYRWIDESDIYMLILGGRYGSIETKSGKSYTQLEYEYACMKEIPLFAIVLSDSYLENKSIKKPEIDILSGISMDEYQIFKKSVMSKIVKIVNEYDEIKSSIMGSLLQIDRNNDIKGWISGYDFSQMEYELKYYKKCDIDHERKMKELEKESQNKNKELLSSFVSLLGGVITIIWHFFFSRRRDN